MVNSISGVNAGYLGSMQGVTSLIQSASSDGTGLFDALAGNNTDNSSQGLLNALAGNNGQSTTVASILHKQDVTSSTNGIYVSVGQHIDAIQQGTYTAQTDWEKAVAVAMSKGRPVMASIDKSGQIQADYQENTDLVTKYGAQRAQLITQAISDVQTVAGKIQANKNFDSMVTELNSAETDLTGVYTAAITAQSSTANDWEQQGVLLMQQNKPMVISLDTKGNLTVTDQSLSDMSDLPEPQQELLQAAVEHIPDVIASGNVDMVPTDRDPTVVQPANWQLDAINFASQGIPYYLSIDVGTNQISANEASGANIMPDFLKTKPFPDIGANTPALQQAAQFIQDGKAFFMDFDQTGQTVIPKELNATNMIKYNTAATSSASSTLGTGSILSLFA